MASIDAEPAGAPAAVSKLYASGLTIADFAACRSAGLRPVGLVQGFCATTLLYWRQGGANARPTVAGDAVGTAAITQTWGKALATAYKRMHMEAARAEAHGIIGIVDSVTTLDTQRALQFHVWGTAVVADGQPVPEQIWSTFLAGARLSKLMEAGLKPVSTMTCRSTATMWTLGAGTGAWKYWRSSAWSLLDGSGVVSQLTPAPSPARQVNGQGLLSIIEMAVRRDARDHLRSVLGGDSLHGAELHVANEHLHHEPPILFVKCTLRGTRVRRFKATAPMQPPVPTVRLS